MNVNKNTNFFFIIISVVVVFYSKPIEAAEVDLNNLLALFDRPLEPVPLYLLPVKPVIELVGNATQTITGIFGGIFGGGGGGGAPPVVPETIEEAKDYTKLLEDISLLGKRDEFSVFIPKHIHIASKLIDLFLDAKDAKELLALAAKAREVCNPYLFNYAYSVALMHRPDTDGSTLPTQIQSFPYKYFDKQVFLPARAQAASTSSANERIPIELERTASDFEDEFRLSYWREDIAVNLHHWHWHLAYPNMGNERIITKDRRGELFYYMHQQILARYNFERLSNNLKLVEKLSNWNAPIKEAYFPKLDNIIAKDIYPSRPQNMIMDDLKIAKEDIELDIADMVSYRDRISRAIDLGYAESANGEKVFLDNVTGINTLGNILESSDLSPNPGFYGNLHGSGHLMIAYIHDPKHHHLQPIAVMGDTATAMRDPVFYRWHAYINDILTQFKNTLPPYTVDELDFSKIRVSSVKVKIEGEASDNVFHTHWKKTDVDLNHGLDFSKATGKVLVRYSHLNHRNFKYEINVENAGNGAQEGICRIYLGPAIDEARKPWSRFLDQKSTFIEMDKFKVNLRPGMNKITRMSLDSTVTIPFEETFYDFDKKQQGDKYKYVYSGCGWPHHLLVPKGSAQGFPSQLFVMISNYGEDKVENAKNSYNEGYCGVRGGKFPHKRPMGFPFDRSPRSGARTLKEFLTPNMYVKDCQIMHNNV